MKDRKKSIFKRWWFWVIIVVAIIGAAANGNEPQKIGEVNSAPASQSGAQKDNAPKTFKIGDVVQLKDFKVTVNGIRTLTQDKTGYLKAEEGNEFFLVDCTVENISNKEQTVSSIMMFKVVDKDGMQYNIEIFPDAKGQLDGTIGSTRKIKGEYAVQVPKGKTGLELVFDSSFLTGDQVIVELR